MAGPINSLLAPVGIRPFSGGPYPDAGLGDKSQQASAPLQSAGQGLLDQAKTAIPNLFSQYSGTTGVLNPLTGKPGEAGGVGPYKLSPTHLANYNNQASIINAARKQAISNLNANYGGRGIGASKGQMKALTQQVNNYADSHLNDVYNQIVQAAHKEQIDALSNLFGQANTMNAQGGNLISGNVGNLNTQAAAATQRTNQGNSALGSALGTAIGGFLPIPKANAAPVVSGPNPNANGGWNNYGTYGPPIFDNYNPNNSALDLTSGAY